MRPELAHRIRRNATVQMRYRNTTKSWAAKVLSTMASVVRSGKHLRRVCCPQHERVRDDRHVAWRGSCVRACFQQIREKFRIDGILEVTFKFSRIWCVYLNIVHVNKCVIAYIQNVREIEIDAYIGRHTHYITVMWACCPIVIVSRIRGYRTYAHAMCVFGRVNMYCVSWICGWSSRVHANFFCLHSIRVCVF